MALLVATTTWSHVKATGSPFTVNLSQPATAGSKLVFVSAGGAISTVSGFTMRTTYGNGVQDVSMSDMTAAGGETSVTVSLNGGGDNVAGMIYEFGPGLTYSTSSNNGIGVTTSATSDNQVASASSTVGAASLLIGLWSVSTGAAYSTANRFRQMGPLGKIYGSGGNQPGTDTEFIWASGLADVDATHRYPQNLANGDYQATTTYLSSGVCFAAQAVYVDTSGVATVPAFSNSVVAENTLPGTDYTNWYFGNSGTDSTIAGYTDKVSYAPGDTVNFKVDSTGNPFRVEIYRLGFYGWDTFGARHVLGNQAGYITGTITAQSAPVVDGTLGSTSCNWTTNATWTVPSDAVSGMYYVVFKRTDNTTFASTTHFVIRSTSLADKAVVITPDATHQAYNIWGATTDSGNSETGTWTGRSLYQIGTDGAAANFAHRAYGVSFDRPYSVQSTLTETYIFDSEMGLINFMEAQGYDLCYLSDIDLDGSPNALDTAKMVIMNGHHKYWTSDMYSAFQNAILAGVNTFINSSSTGGWRIRFAPGDTNRRTIICYKDSGTADVSAGWSGTGYDPISYTGTWRDIRTDVGVVNNTDIRSENALTGQLFRVAGPYQTNLDVPFASKTAPIWRNSAAIQALTVGQVYSTPADVVGYEVDAPDGSAGQPSKLVNLSPMVIPYTTGTNQAGSTYSAAGSVTIGFTLYYANSGALVFNTGNWRGWLSVSRYQQGTGAISTIDLNWQNALLAILYDLGQTPVTLQSMEPGQDSDVTDPSIGAPVQSQTIVAQAYGLSLANLGGFTTFFS